MPPFNRAGSIVLVHDCGVRLDSAAMAPARPSPRRHGLYAAFPAFSKPELPLPSQLAHSPNIDFVVEERRRSRPEHQERVGNVGNVGVALN